MNKTILTLGVFLVFTCHSIGQINPVINLTWDQYYVTPNNYFELKWEEPEAPHDELIGYNIYRGDELYRFQTENSLYHLEEGSNCDIDFLFYNEGEGFLAHVTAVYNPGQVESDYTETVEIEGPLLSNKDIKQEKPILYPNPTTGILNIENVTVNKILIYDLSGKLISKLSSQHQINVSNLSKGVYLFKLISEEEIIVNKIVVE